MQVVRSVPTIVVWIAREVISRHEENEEETGWGVGAAPSQVGMYAGEAGTYFHPRLPLQLFFYLLGEGRRRKEKKILGTSIAEGRVDRNKKGR